jgi:carbon storage regulator
MLVLTRKPGEEIVISGGIRLTIVAVNGNKVRIGVVAPPAVLVDRAEVAERRQQEGSILCEAEAPTLPCPLAPGGVRA